MWYKSLCREEQERGEEEKEEEERRHDIMNTDKRIDLNELDPRFVLWVLSPTSLEEASAVREAQARIRGARQTAEIQALSREGLHCWRRRQRVAGGGARRGGPGVRR